MPSGCGKDMYVGLIAVLEGAVGEPRLDFSVVDDELFDEGFTVSAGNSITSGESCSLDPTVCVVSIGFNGENLFSVELDSRWFGIIRLEVTVVANDRCGSS